MALWFCMMRCDDSTYCDSTWFVHDDMWWFPSLVSPNAFLSLSDSRNSSGGQPFLAPRLGSLLTRQFRWSIAVGTQPSQNGGQTHFPCWFLVSQQDAQWLWPCPAAVYCIELDRGTWRNPVSGGLKGLPDIVVSVRRCKLFHLMEAWMPDAQRRLPMLKDRSPFATQLNWTQTIRSAPMYLQISMHHFTQQFGLLLGVGLVAPK